MKEKTTRKTLHSSDSLERKLRSHGKRFWAWRERSGL